MTFPAGYTAVVVGAGAGIGRATAIHLAAQGVSVVAADLDGDAAARTASRITESGGASLALAADVTDAASLERAVAVSIDWRGRIHALINSAGVQGPLGRPSHEVDVASFERTLRINLTSGLLIARAVVPHMLEHGYGRIAHVASIAGKEGNPNMVAYSASKAGLIGMVKAQGKEYAGTGITVNAIAPAVIRTPFLDSQPKEVVDYMVSRIPMGRVGEADEVAAMLAFMISPACSFTTGFTFDLSGGRATH